MTPHEYLKNIEYIVDLIKRDEDKIAQDIFNSEILPLKKQFLMSEKSPLRDVRDYIFELGEYLNDDSWKSIRATNKKYILDAYQTDFLTFIKNYPDNKVPR